jgi:hypothetical protein
LDFWDFDLFKKIVIMKSAGCHGFAAMTSGRFFVEDNDYEGLL